MTENLIIDGVDHAKFDLEWVKKGGVAYGVTQAGTYTLWTYFQGRFAFLAVRYQHCDWAKAGPQMCLGSLFNDTYVKIADRMTSQQSARRQWPLQSITQLLKHAPTQKMSAAYLTATQCTTNTAVYVGCF